MGTVGAELSKEDCFCHLSPFSNRWSMADFLELNWSNVGNLRRVVQDLHMDTCCSIKAFLGVDKGSMFLDCRCLVQRLLVHAAAQLGIDLSFRTPER